MVDARPTPPTMDKPGGASARRRVPEISRPPKPPVNLSLSGMAGARADCSVLGVTNSDGRTVRR